MRTRVVLRVLVSAAFGGASRVSVRDRLKSAQEPMHHPEGASLARLPFREEGAAWD